MFARTFLGIPDVDPTPQDGYVGAWSAGVGRALWKPITGALLSGFAAGLVAFGAAGGAAGSGLTTDANFSYAGGALSLANAGATHVISGAVTVAGGTGGPTLLGKTGNYGALSFNNTASFSTGVAIIGGSTSDKDLYLCVPSVNQVHLRAGGTDMAVINGSGFAITPATTISDGTASSSTTTGAFVVTGGAGFGGDVNAGGKFQTTGAGNVFNASAATTSQKYHHIQNTGADFYFGVESSVAGAFFTGSAAYDCAIYSPAHLYIAGFNGVKIGGGDVTLTNNLIVDGGTGKSLRVTNHVANGAIATTLGSVGPTGSTAGNPQGWLRISDNGTDRFIPFW